MARKFAAGSLLVSNPAPMNGTANSSKSLINTTPAVRVVFTGGDFRDETEPTIDLDWSILVVTGWHGETQKERRRGDGGGYAICESDHGGNPQRRSR